MERKYKLTYKPENQVIVTVGGSEAIDLCIRALKNGDEDIERMRDEDNYRRRVIVDGFRKMGLSCFEPEGAFYVFPSVKSTNFSSEEFSEKLLYNQKVAVVPGNAFGDSGEGFIRCSYAYSIDNINEALLRIDRFINEKI